MITIKSPLRISLFGGSTDYADFYKEYGSFLIGTTINKFIYLSMRPVPGILLRNGEFKYRLSYSKIETVNRIDEIENKLIRETFRYKNVKSPMEFIAFVDIPARTGLGGSSSYCVGLVHLINIINDTSSNKKIIANEAIHIERTILQESGGIQDHIWASYGGFNSIEIQPTGEFNVKPMPITSEFKQALEDSMVLIYTNDQRDQNEIAKSHENKNKINILNIAKEAYTAFNAEDIKSIGCLLYESWKEKTNISNLISNDKINAIMNDVMNMGAYGVKLLGSGGCGFILAMCDPSVKRKINEKYSEVLLDFKFENGGVSEIYRS
jgi:D-glycero-alpha-D-manno-heptose-7-phosphate kinase